MTVKLVRLLAVLTMTLAMIIPSAGSSNANPPTPERSRYGINPLLIVFDLSGSMGEDDGTGTVKLEGAKNSMADLVSRQPAGAEMGLWTYPGSGQSCDPGGYLPGSELRRVQDPNQMAATIRDLQADGGTPTAEALEAAADSLRDRGRTGANMVLVSDGHSTCGDPCEVAKSLAAEGFDITVDTVGFRIDDSGAEELQCISDATQGAYYDAEDSEALSKKLSELSLPALVVDVDTPQAVPSGGLATITATVRNPSATTIRDVWVGLQFTQDGVDNAILPAVIPPRFRLGRLGSGDSQTRKWKVTTGPKGKDATMSWSVSAWGETTMPQVERGSIIVTKNIDPSRSGKVLADVLASPASAIIMGDSYSSGEGTFKYLSGNDTHDPSCHRSDRQYASQLLATAQNPRVRNIACSGAVLADLISPQLAFDPEDPKGSTGFKTRNGQLQILDRQEAPSAVFLTIGGNDIGFGTLASKCVLSSCDKNDELDQMIDDGLQGLQQLSRYYAEIYRIINTDDKREARDGQVAPVIVSPYPWVLPNAASASCGLIDRDEVNFLNWVQGRLNETIRTQVKAAQDKGAEVYYAGNVVDAMANHTACDKEPYINPINGGDAIAAGAADTFNQALDFMNLAPGANSHLLAEFLHPNVAGHGAIASAIATWSNPDAARPGYRSLEPAFNLESDGFDEDLAHSVDLTSAMRTDVPGPLEAAGDFAVKAGEMLGIAMRQGTCVACSVKVGAESSPRTLGWATTADDGSLNAVVAIPVDMPPGVHHLTFTTIDTDGAITTSSVEFRVHKPLPWWFWGMAGVAVAAVVVAVVMFWRARRLRE